jgi:hypothetical protein
MSPVSYALSRRGFLALAGAAPLARAQQPAPIFDANTLDGWEIVNGEASDYSVQDGAIVVSPFTSYPTWLRTVKEYENFDFSCEFFLKGWTDSGIYLFAPRYGPPTDCGMQVKIFHRAEEPTPYSCGSIFPVAAPAKVPVKVEWNTLRIRSEWPRLEIWMNGEKVQDLDRSTHPELRERLRMGHIGIVSASSQCRFRNLRIAELPGALQWDVLYEKPVDLDAHWVVSEGKPDFQTFGPILRTDAYGHLATKRKFRNFELELYTRGMAQHNSGILFRSNGRGSEKPQHYEIQLHSAPEAHFPTGSLYHYKRAKYPRIRDEEWYLFQMRVMERDVMVRINGETVMEYGGLNILDDGFIELQAHRRGYWTEFQRIRVRTLG